MAKNEQTNRFGNNTVTAIPDDAPLFSKPGHKLRTSNQIVDRSALPQVEYQVIDTSQLTHLPGQKVKTVSHDGQEGIIRLDADGEHEHLVPNQFTGPSFRTQRERFRFDGHKMMHHLDRVMAWQ
ncbi:MAG: radical SAM protein, partial [Methylococcaceae bacterium]|nr:radical SAM protein [Methylococcaceae bacterium]